MTLKKPIISTVVAIGSDHQHNRVIGKTNELLWNIPDDLKRFKALTTGHPVIMGRKTYDSIFAMRQKPLPGRTNIIVTRSPAELAGDVKYAFENVLLTSSLEEAVAKAKELDQEEIFIGGGSQIYEQALPILDRLYVTLIDDEKEGDSYFPAYEGLFTKVIFHEDREHEGLKYKWVDLERA
jgi:dihydrofolate reductase